MVCLDSSVQAPEKQIMRLDCREIDLNFQKKEKQHTASQKPLSLRHNLLHF